MDHYEISTDFKGQAVHESITIAALLHSKKYPLSWETHAGNMTWLMDRDTFEFVRGIFWNDDPACELFNDDRDPESNRNTATGLVWYQRFSREDPRDIITRSHHGDLQFLHAMATELGQDPNVTRQLCLDWAKLMYELAVGAVSEWTLLQDTYLKKSFHNGTSPPGSIPLRELLLQGNASNYNWVKIDRRALGTVMHMIQDSYSRGHCQREILNPQNIDYGTSNILKFQDNQPGRFGAIENFHYYHGQSDDHSSYDVKPQQFGSMAIVPKNLSTFDDIIGARDSIDQCTKLVAFWCDKVQWEDGPRQLLEEIFTLSQHATPSNTNV
ncbi:hypothetical protein EDC01DRAFT_624058 [Geopyxis carbonaria]|nr:hypothetical protein EDC01DRAFT_624058 [Geopyxis carbonaria]